MNARSTWMHRARKNSTSWNGSFPFRCVRETRDSRARASSTSLLDGIVLQRVQSDEDVGSNRVEATELWDEDAEERIVFAFATHFADLTTWEYARVLKKEKKKLEESNVKLVFVAIGRPEQAKLFCKECNFDEQDVYCDPEGNSYEKLGFNRGFAPDTNVSGYLKLLAMLAGLGSPGTIPEVLRGYVGDRNANPWFGEDETLGKLFGSLGGGYQRPFELATVRLQNMVSVLSKWQELCPSDDRKLTQLGGTLAFVGEELVYRFDDTGILVYADVDELMKRVTS